MVEDLKLKKIYASILLFNLLFLNISCFALEIDLAKNKYPSYSLFFLNEDKHENFNRKMFDLNLKMNKIFVKKIHVLWASLFPKFVINGLNCAYSNIEYPKRLISSLIQKDFCAVKNETKRFFINTFLGVGGFMDVAKMKFNLELYNEDMEQALAKCKVKCGNYLVMPFISSCTTRDLFGRILDFILTPTTYVATPIAAAVKMGLLINRTTNIQPMIKMVESRFPDPYDIAKKFWGVDKYIKLSNFDRKEVVEKIEKQFEKEITPLVDNKQEVLSVKGNIGKNIVVKMLDEDLSADIFLKDFNPQSPVLDSMRTALFEVKNSKNAFWDEISIWNRNFSKKFKKASVKMFENEDDYAFRYVLQKDKKSPLAILFPSIGEGMENNHSTLLAKIFYDEGYSVLIIGSHFQWEFLKSLQKGYKMGYIKEDIKYVNLLLNRAISHISKKHDRVFLKRIAFGTSLGAYTALFLANEQAQNNARNIDKFISVCPPFALFYAIDKIDKIISSWKDYPYDIRQKTALVAAKVLKAFENKKQISNNFDNLPFSNSDAELISAFVFHQKLSDLIFETETIQNPNIDKKELYNSIYTLDYHDYIEKYLLVNHSYDEIDSASSLKSISDYLINNDNYKIFHSLDDYLISKNQLKELKSFSDEKMVLFSNGSHLGFLYRDEFIEALKKEIKL